MRNRSSIVEQIEVGHDTPSFAQAVRSVLRQDPDVILVGEMRDSETMSAALTAAETGHLVLSSSTQTILPRPSPASSTSFPPGISHRYGNNYPLLCWRSLPSNSCRLPIMPIATRRSKF